jgi:peptide methionine sulfoxide reductase msrA/msrB
MQNWKTLTPEEERVIIKKGTEPPFSGEYTDTIESGIYLCRQCKAPLYRSEQKFHSGCGWPSFDGELPNAVKRVRDADGIRTEIVCAKCGGHLGHVFAGEGFTPPNIRHCVNSISMSFVPDKIQAKAWFGGGCFWGVEYFMKQLSGVIDVTSGYMGGTLPNPTYEDVCAGASGHAEVVEVTYNTASLSYEQLAKSFFEIHDPTQLNRQGPDIGYQYRSVVFVQNEAERNIICNLIEQLQAIGLNVVTEIEDLVTFYPAEAYHQNYYERKGSTQYCHSYIKRF